MVNAPRGSGVAAVNNSFPQGSCQRGACVAQVGQSGRQVAQEVNCRCSTLQADADTKEGIPK